MFKLLHFSDSHLGLRQYSMTGRLVDFADSLNEVLRIAIEQEVDLVVDTGDTFDSPDPGPYSIAAMRRFVQALDLRGIKFLGLVGNHNYHSDGKILEKASWFDAVSDSVIRPSKPQTPMQLWSLDLKSHISVVCADWMPSDKITEFLSEIPHPVDAIFMHQSCEGFMPVIGRPEMFLSQIDGKARYAGIGDIHVTKKQETPSGTIVGSSGSTELVKSNEPAQKYVVLVTFETGGSSEPPTWTPIEIKTRRVLNFPCIRNESQIESFRSTIMTALSACGDKKPMVICSYVRSLSKNMEAFQSSLESLGISLIRFTPEPDVVSVEEVAEERVTQSTSMADILDETLRDSDSKSLALRLWSSPLMAENILEKFKQSVIEKHINESKQGQA